MNTAGSSGEISTQKTAVEKKKKSILRVRNSYSGHTEKVSPQSRAGIQEMKPSISLRVSVFTVSKGSSSPNLGVVHLKKDRLGY